MPCKVNAPPPPPLRGALPIWTDTCQKLGCHQDMGEVEGRGVDQLVKEVTSGEDLGENMQGFLGRSTEGAGDEANTFVEHKLSPCT